jgi:hypothetical protein
VRGIAVGGSGRRGFLNSKVDFVAQQQGVAINLQLVRQPPQGCWFNCLSHMNLAQSIK